MRKEVIKMIKNNPELLPEPYYTLTEIIGIESIIKMASQYGGSTIYLPKLDNSTTVARDICIKQEFTGYNHLELARKYNLSVQSIKRIIKQKEGVKEAANI